MLGTAPTMRGTALTMLGTAPTMLGTAPTMLGTAPTMLGIGKGTVPISCRPHRPRRRWALVLVDEVPAVLVILIYTLVGMGG